MYKNKNSLLSVLILYLTILFVLIVEQTLLNILPYTLALTIAVITTLLTPIVFISMIYYIVVRKYQLPFCKSLDLRFNTCSSFTGLLGYMAIIFISNIAIAGLVSAGYSSPETDNVVLSIPFFVYVINMFGALVIAPVMEEIIFRGFIQNILCGKFGDFIGVVSTALMFGLSHICYSGDLIALSFTVTCGLVLGFIKQRYKNLGACMFGHFFVNLSACVKSFM